MRKLRCGSGESKVSDRTDVMSTKIRASRQGDLEERQSKGNKFEK